MGGEIGEPSGSIAIGDLLAVDAVFRMAGVPAALGGVTTGRQAIVTSNVQVGLVDVNTLTV